MVQLLWAFLPCSDVVAEEEILLLQLRLSLLRRLVVAVFWLPAAVVAVFCALFAEDWDALGEESWMRYRAPALLARATCACLGCSCCAVVVLFVVVLDAGSSLQEGL